MGLCAPREDLTPQFVLQPGCFLSSAWWLGMGNLFQPELG